MPLLRIRKQIDYQSTEKRGQWSLNRNNRKNEKIKKKQLTKTTAYDMIFKLLSENSVAKNKKKLLTKTTACGNINELSMRQQQRTLKTEQYVKP